MLVKAFLMKNDDQSVKVPFLFNPSQLVIEKGHQFAERYLILDLWFDTYEEKADVRNLMDGITGWVSDLHSPTVCLFVWGSFIFPCIIERMSTNFTKILSRGIPVRAVVNITLKEYKNPSTKTDESIS